MLDPYRKSFHLSRSWPRIREFKGSNPSESSHRLGEPDSRIIEAMPISRPARIVTGITLIAVPTILYGGITLLGVLTQGTAGLAPSGFFGLAFFPGFRWMLYLGGLLLVLSVLVTAAGLVFSPATTR